MAEQSPDRFDVVAGGQPGPSVVPVPTTAQGDDGDLAESLADLSRLSAARLGLEDLLTRVATFAVHAIPGADGAGLALIEPGRSETIVKSAAFVEQVDGIQYSINEGPCILAAATG